MLRPHIATPANVSSRNRHQHIVFFKDRPPESLMSFFIDEGKSATVQAGIAIKCFGPDEVDA
jgi:hypothetical protein